MTSCKELTVSYICRTGGVFVFAQRLALKKSEWFCLYNLLLLRLSLFSMHLLYLHTSIPLVRGFDNLFHSSFVKSQKFLGLI